ncbi:hypothetical protein Ddye_028452 [Dipteronia dyeriana]|uniref:YqgF/RNase H-like domain-containing protein n=1 Tax=Dipteronia dyeriana TaxID=168575 RepID=A0AAD9TR28_9ROSI|nr:hypothetical protein Ddye_028452 [Dipteronia dyeriana]
MRYVKPLDLYEQVLEKSLKVKWNGSFLAMDVGKDSVSLACSFPDCKTAVDVGTVQIARSEETTPIMVRMFQNAVKMTKAKGLIVGYPCVWMLQIYSRKIQGSLMVILMKWSHVFKILLLRYSRHTQGSLMVILMFLLLIYCRDT